MKTSFFIIFFDRYPLKDHYDIYDNRRITNPALYSMNGEIGPIDAIALQLEELHPLRKNVHQIRLDEYKI